LISGSAGGYSNLVQVFRATAIFYTTIKKLYSRPVPWLNESEKEELFEDKKCGLSSMGFFPGIEYLSKTSILNGEL
jgi:hypothetical protein